MNHQVGEIGYFQLNNLVRNKVPFALLLVDMDVSENLEEPIAMVMRSGVCLKAQNFWAHVEHMGCPLEHPFVLMCPEGDISLSLASEMVEKGYKNIYCIKGGWKSFHSI